MSNVKYGIAQVSYQQDGTSARSNSSKGNAVDDASAPEGLRDSWPGRWAIPKTRSPIRTIFQASIELL